METLIGCKYCVRNFNKKIFSGSSSTTNEPNFKIMCNYIHELLNVFEDPAQCIHTIVESLGKPNNNKVFKIVFWKVFVFKYCPDKSGCNFICMWKVCICIKYYTLYLTPSLIC